jgi:hypothetical protein
MAGFFYVLILPAEPQAFTANPLLNIEQIENGKFSEKKSVLHRIGPKLSIWRGPESFMHGIFVKR